MPILLYVRNQLNKVVGTLDIDYVAEGNFYYDGGVKTTGLGYHGDS